MARFPKKQAEIVALAERLWNGLWQNQDIYPQPPVHPILIRIKSMIYSSRRDDLIAKQAAAEQTTTTKDEALDDLVEAMNADSPSRPSEIAGSAETGRGLDILGQQSR